MCGICGYVGDHRPELLEAMCRIMAHRGPDGMGTWHDAHARVGLGHRRLAIIDLSPGGNQPMCNEDGTIWISFNGEIYDFERHREDLLARGHIFRGRSDTEVLLHLYEEHGLDFLQKLNGMFAIALWDGRERRLLLARDHAGIKPVYYYTRGDALYFASEIKALMKIPGIPRELALDVLPDYMTFLWVPNSRTLLKGFSKLEPGQYLLWKDGRVEIRNWFELRYEPDERVSEREWVERVHDTFLRTTTRQMVSDVPLGAFLSGGLDSSSIVACMRQAFPDRPIRCYTVELAEADMTCDRFENDFPFAMRVAQKLGVELKSFVFRPEMISLLPKMIYHLDVPDADPALIPCYLISKLAREDGTKVLLSGTGGDEVFFGYRSHVAYRKYARLDWLPRTLTAPALSVTTRVSSRLLGAGSPAPRRLRKFSRGLLERGPRRHLALVDWSSPLTRRKLYSPAVRALFPEEETVPHSIQHHYESFVGRGLLNQHSHVLIQGFLGAHNMIYTDKTSMAASVEVRVPFMDVELMRLAATIPEHYKLHGNITKYVLKRAMEPHLDSAVLYRGKTGFGAPLRQWMAHDLRPLLDELLSEERIKQRGLFDPAAVRHAIVQNAANREDHSYLLYCLLTLEVWQQTFIDRPAVEVSF